MTLSDKRAQMMDALVSWAIGRCQTDPGPLSTDERELLRSLLVYLADSGYPNSGSIVPLLSERLQVERRRWAEERR